MSLPVRSNKKASKEDVFCRQAFQCWSFLLLWQGQHFWHQKLREDEREVQVAFLQAQEAKVQQEQEARQLQQRVLDLEHALQERHDWTRQYEELKANRVTRMPRSTRGPFFVRGSLVNLLGLRFRVRV